MISEKKWRAKNTDMALFFFSYSSVVLSSYSSHVSPYEARVSYSMVPLAFSLSLRGQGFCLFWVFKAMFTVFFLDRIWVFCAASRDFTSLGVSRPSVVDVAKQGRRKE